MLVALTALPLTSGDRAVTVAEAQSVRSPGQTPAQVRAFLAIPRKPLSADHKRWDVVASCPACHDGYRRRIDDNKCLSCHEHKLLRGRLRAGHGFHATSKVKGKRCQRCHDEHEGRGFDIRGWNLMPGGERGFDHRLTAWPLAGAHVGVACATCHPQTNRAKRRVYLLVDKLCGSCHADEQPHGFDRRLNMKCDRCHTQTAWAPTRRDWDFDHDDPRQAHFATTATHANVACRQCHPRGAFNLGLAAPRDCRNCHGRFALEPPQCRACHAAPEARRIGR